MSPIDIQVNRIASKRTSDHEVFESYTGFAIQCLNVLRPEMSPDALRWLELAIKNSNGSTTIEEMKQVSLEVDRFSSKRGEGLYNTVRSTEGAIAFLLRDILYHESAPWRPDKADVVMALDVFIDKFVEFFGRKDVVVAALKSSFK